MSEATEKIRQIFRKHYFSKALEVTLKEVEKEVLAAVESMEQQITAKEFARKEAIRDKQKAEQRLSEIHQKMRAQIIRLGMIRAGNIDQIWDAGWAYGLLAQIGKAPEFKTRKEPFEWAKAKICRFQKREDSERELLDDEQP